MTRIHSTQNFLSILFPLQHFAIEVMSHSCWRRILCLCDIETPNLFSRAKSWVFAPLSRRITEMQLARADILWFRVLEVADVARAIALLTFISFSSDLCTPQAPTTLACQKGHHLHFLCDKAIRVRCEFFGWSAFKNRVCALAVIVKLARHFGGQDTAPYLGVWKQCTLRFSTFVKECF